MDDATRDEENGLSNDVVLSAVRLERSVGTRVLWRDLSFELRRGESVAVTGPSGSGKTVLLRTLAGLDPIEAGQVIFEGRPQDEWPMPIYRARVMYLAQRPAVFEGSVLDNLKRPFTLRVHRGRSFEPEKARMLIRALGRDEGFLSLNAPNLSGGEAQLMALTRALLLQPQVLLLDEATASLDPATTRLAEELLSRWRREDPNRASIWVSHDPAQLARATSREIPIRPTPEGAT